MPTSAPHAKFIFAEAFSPLPLDGAACTAADQDGLAARIRTLATQVHKQQGEYQPVYGFDEAFGPGPRQDHLTDNCALVERHFSHVRGKQHVRILDVGCNNGYACFTLARTFPHVVGLEISPLHLELCRSLAAYHGSTARFFGHDLLSLMETGEADLVNVDCVLLFNVVHQLIFARGLPYVKTFLSHLVQQVDVVFVELATRADYRPHGLDHLLPTDPAEALAECRDCDIELVKTGHRPLYALRRRRLRFGAENLCITGVEFSEHPNAMVSRKYYASCDRFLKLVRFTPTQDATGFHAEVNALLKLRDMQVSPRLFEWKKDERASHVLMERIYGPALNTCLQEFTDDASRKRIIGELLRIAAAIHHAGFFQNDFSAHNFVLAAPGQLRLLDFDQSRPHAVFDHFGFLLWIVNDLYKQRPQSYELCIYKDLYAAPGSERASREFYPDLQEAKADPFMRSFIEAACAAPSWGGFTTDWAERFARHLANPPADEGDHQQTEAPAAGCNGQNAKVEPPEPPSPASSARGQDRSKVFEVTGAEA